MPEITTDEDGNEYLVVRNEVFTLFWPLNQPDPEDDWFDEEEAGMTYDEWLRRRR